MPFLTDLRARLTGPVVAAVEAAKAAAERAIPRKAAPAEAELPPAPTLDDLLPPPPLKRALRHAPLETAEPAEARPTPAPMPLAVQPAEPIPEPDPLELAYQHLARMNSALAATGDAEVAAAGARFHASARALLEALSRNPSALGNHQHPLASWVPGLALATERYATLHHRAPDPDRRTILVSVLDQVARRIRAHADAAETGNGEFRAA